MNEMERPEDTVRRLAARVIDLEQWQQQYKEAAELWEALETAQGDRIVEAMLVAKLHNFENGRTEISISVTDGVDWVGQLGLIGAAQLMSNQTPVIGGEDD